MTDDLLQALEDSDAAGMSNLFGKKMKEGRDVWEIHLSLFPTVQRVLNPPFINPHLPKMYRIYREFIPYLERDERPALVRLELTEYTRRPKLEKLPKPDTFASSVTFKEVESGIKARDLEKTVALMAAFFRRQGGRDLARRLLLLGSGYLDDSLGHSVSCTAFILLEMLERKDQDSWPALSTLSDYFCKGEFDTTPPFRKLTRFPSDDVLNHHLLRAASGRGIVNLHHTITRYAIERVRHLFSQEEYEHMIGSWIDFLGDKGAEEVTLGRPPKGIADYEEFYGPFSKLEAEPVVSSLREMLPSEQGRSTLGRFLIKGVCDQYQGDYNPHYLTGLGSALWVVDQFWNRVPIATNAIFQYVNYFFAGLKSDR